MRESLSTYGPRVDVEPRMGLTAQRAAPSAPVGVCTPPEYVTAEDCATPVATGVISIGVWR
jgi:hypothetical protein